ncbi:MAG: BatA domain-containing protein [Verrucomicrobiota bacterium]
MSFLQPILLLGLPLALLPIIIHLINQHRHRTVEWAAMMFLLDAKKLTKGIARLRQILILALRVFAVLFLVFAASRPLAGGWLALTGGKPDTILILLDRSSSMEEQILETGDSKRSAAVEKLAELIEKTSRGSNLVLIDSATLEATPIADPAALIDIPQVAPTSTHSDIPALLQSAIDFLDTDESGRTDIWLASDLRQSDWQTGSAKWQSIRSDLSARDTIRLFLLNYREVAEDNLALSVSNVKRRKSQEGMQLIMDLRVTRASSSEEETRLPVEFTINGTRTIEEMVFTGPEMNRLGFTLDLGQSETRGWGRVDLPADGNPLDNTAFLVFDEEATRKTVVVSDDRLITRSIEAAANAAVEPGITYETEIIAPDQLTRIPWEETALLFWHAPIPMANSPEFALLRQHAESGRSLVFLPPAEESNEAIFGFQWGDWREAGEEPLSVDWWRTESGLLENTRSGEPLPVSEIQFFRSRAFEGELQPLLRSGSDSVLIARITSETSGAVYAWGTLPRTDHSSLATEGIVFFVMIHRALEQGANAVAKARFEETRRGVLADSTNYSEIDAKESRQSPSMGGLLPSALRWQTSSGEERLLALNRPITEDDTRLVDPEALDPLLEGVEFRRVSDELASGSSLASEVWRLFLIFMALALLSEAILCLPARTTEETSSPDMHPFSESPGK